MKRLLSFFLALCCTVTFCVYGTFSTSALAEIPPRTLSDQTNYGDALYEIAYHALGYYDDFGQRTDWEEETFSADFVLDFVTRYADTPGMGGYFPFEEYQTEHFEDMTVRYSVPAEKMEKKIGLDFELNDALRTALQTDPRYNAETQTYDFIRGGVGGFGVDYSYIGYLSNDSEHYTLYFQRYVTDDPLASTEGLTENVDYVLVYDWETGGDLPYAITGLFAVTFRYDGYNAILTKVQKPVGIPEVELIFIPNYNVGLTAINEKSNASGYGWEWKAETKTLTLDGINMASYLLYDDWTENTSAEERSCLSMGATMICLPEDSTLVINRDNAIHMDTVGSMMNLSILSQGSLSMTGSGSLTVDGAAAIHDILNFDTGELVKTGSLTLDGPTVSISSMGAFDYALNTTVFQLKNGSIKAAAPLGGLYAHDLTVSGGSALLQGLQSEDDAEQATGVYAAAVNLFVDMDGEAPSLDLGDGYKALYHTGSGYYGEAELGQAQLELYNETPNNTFVTADGKIVTNLLLSDQESGVAVEKDGLSLSADAGAFSEETVIDIVKLATGEIFDRVAESLSELARDFLAFEITATEDGQAVQPDGTVSMTVDIPLNFNMDNLAVFYVSEDGTYEQLPAVVDKVARTASFVTTHFSTYVVAETHEPMPLQTVGDINADKAINASDALIALQHSVKLVKLTGDAFTAADVNVNGTVDATDALYILQYSVYLIDTLPVKAQ